jgi:protein-disulfide isomerase
MSPSAKMKPPVGANDHVQGTANAPVTLVEYGDYECPYCGEAYPIVKALQERLGKQMRFVFRNFPLSEMHPHAEHAAEAAEAAGGQGAEARHAAIYQGDGVASLRRARARGFQQRREERS